MKTVIDKNCFEPVRAHPTDAGLDLRSPIKIIVRARSRVSINTGVHVQIPDGYAGVLVSKSGLMRNAGITCRGLIDSSYRGAICAVLFNHSDDDYVIERGDKITQLVILPCRLDEIEVVDELDETDRGTSGFGSTGR